MRLRGGKITINELDSIIGLVILSPNHFRINNLRSFLQNALQEYLKAILRVSGHLEIDLSITTHNEYNYILNYILDEYNFSDWFLNIELEIIPTAPNRFRICKQVRALLPIERISLRKQFKAILRDHGHLDFQICVNDTDVIPYLVYDDRDLDSFLTMDWWETMQLEMMPIGFW